MIGPVVSHSDTAITISVRDLPAPDLVYMPVPFNITNLSTQADTDFRQLLKAVNACHQQVFELDGREMHCSAGESEEMELFITSSNVTIRNGKICLGTARHQRLTLFIQGNGVTLDNITIDGGMRGISVKPGGSVTMRECVVQNTRKVGVQIGSSAENSPGNANALLECCVFRHNLSRDIWVADQGSCVEILYCTFSKDPDPDLGDGGVVKILVSSKHSASYRW